MKNVASPPGAVSATGSRLRSGARACLTSLLLLLALRSIAQDTPPLKVVPPSPEAAAAFKFAEVPVSLYTGVPGISVDLHQIQAKGITVPVAISYHGRGVRVDEVASRVGLGWTLSYGGMVSRQTRGRADDHAYGMLGQKTYNEMFNSAQKQHDFYQDMVNHDIDLAPDMFIMDMNGQSVKFSFDPTTGEPVQQKFSDVRIASTRDTNGHIVGFTATDAQGNTYHYGRSQDGLNAAVDFDMVIKNFTYSSNPTIAPSETGPAEDSPAINTWHLMEIVTPYRERIEFRYGKPEEAISVRRSYDKNEDKYATGFSTKIKSVQHQVSEIVFPGGKMVFTPEMKETRKDLTDARALESVSLLDAQGQLRKKFSFVYTHTSSSSNVHPYLRGMDPASDWRMFLDSVQETGRDGKAKPAYRFHYNATQLPSRLSTSQDVWGYYNQKPNGWFMPFFKYDNIHVNREVDTVKAAAGLLERISYPTGGSAEFSYEHNVTAPPAHLKALLTLRINPTRIDLKDGGFLRHEMYYRDGIYSNPVVIGKGIIGNVTFGMDLPYCKGTFEVPAPEECSYKADYTVRLEGEGKSYLLYPREGQTSFGIPAGSYTLKVIPPTNYDPADLLGLFNVTFSWREEFRIPESERLYTSGKRIKRITYKTPEGTAQVREYRYAGGQSFGLPNFYFVNTNDGAFDSVDKHGSIPGSPLSNLQGNTAGYASVTEYYGDGENHQGKTVHEFTVTPDGGNYHKFPYPPPIDNEWLRGKPLITTVYVNNPDPTLKDFHLPKRRVEHTYRYGDGYTDPHYLAYPPITKPEWDYSYTRNRLVYVRPFLIPTTDYWTDTLLARWEPNFVMGGTMDLYQTVETDFYPSETQVRKQTTHRYDYGRHYLPAGSETTDSRGRRVTTTVTYPTSLDGSARTHAEQQLVDQNRVATPLREETAVREGETIVASTARRTTYADGWGSGIVLDSLVEHSVNAGPWQEQVRYGAYDGGGNPLAVTVKEGVQTCYLWGYGSTLPLAQVLNAPYAEVEAALGGAAAVQALSDSPVPTQAQLDQLNGLRAQLPGALVTTYTYEPLVGMRSATDANGRTTHYRYDGMGRLEAVLDEAGNVVKTYQYHYYEGR